jgi:hypothetical protein
MTTWFRCNDARRHEWESWGGQKDIESVICLSCFGRSTRLTGRCKKLHSIIMSLQSESSQPTDTGQIDKHRYKNPCLWLLTIILQVTSPLFVLPKAFDLHLMETRSRVPEARLGFLATNSITAIYLAHPSPHPAHFETRPLPSCYLPGRI